MSVFGLLDRNLDLVALDVAGAKGFDVTIAQSCKTPQKECVPNVVQKGAFEIGVVQGGEFLLGEENDRTVGFFGRKFLVVHVVIESFFGGPVQERLQNFDLLDEGIVRVALTFH